MNIKEQYVRFFQSKGHQWLPAASLVPDDSTTLFTSSGIQQLVPYMVNEEEHPLSNRLTNYQKCLRLTDIEQIGDSYHHTFFEMLGNWSMNDYFKNEVIEMSYEFLTKELNINPNRLAVTVFGGDEKISRDEEAANKWQLLGIPKDRIAYLGYNDNWWPSVNEKGPCGTDTEIFYWRSNDPVPEKFDPNDKRWVEIWNNVFVGFNRNDDKSLRKLNKHYIDTGMGVERMTSILNDLTDNYESEIFKPIINVVEKYADKHYHEEQNKKPMRIIADHIRAIVMICSDDKTIIPSNKDRGYVLRRLIRRVIIASHNLNINDYHNFIVELIHTTINQLADTYPYVKEETDRILSVVINESLKFYKILKDGEKKVKKAISVLREENFDHIDSKIVFRLYETYGIPLDLTFSILDRESISYDKEEVFELLRKHKEESRKQAEQKFGNGISNNNKTKVFKR